MSDTDEFRESLFALRTLLRRAITVPNTAQWRLEAGDSPVVVASVPAALLARNLQEHSAATPFFALCLAWWFEKLERFSGQKLRARVEVLEGPLPTTPHGRRAAFVLHELGSLLPDRFACVPSQPVPWPDAPRLNSAGVDRDVSADPTAGGEHAIEVAFTRQPELVKQFASIDTIERFSRQLPLGLFDGAVRSDARWSPGGKSQLDLWAPSRDGRTVHVFELKDAGNCQVGILPEALWYTRLLHRIRTRDFGGRDVVGEGAAFEAVRCAEKIAMWLLVQDCHPLVRMGRDSPLAWLRAPLHAQGVSMGVLPYAYNHGQVRLKPEHRWE